MSSRKIRRAAAHATETSNKTASVNERALPSPISLNRHNGFFAVLPTEDQDSFETLRESLAAEHRPTTVTEGILVNMMAESYWLALRARRLAQTATDLETGIITDPKSFALYFRCETTHSLAFHKALNDLLKLRAARSRNPVGFEAQNAEPVPEPAPGPVNPEFEAAMTAAEPESEHLKSEILTQHVLPGETAA